MFHIFNSQEERRAFGGSCFIEFQYCRHCAKTALKRILNNPNHWQDGSLYVADLDLFYTEYGCIFDCGIYHNMKTGTVDLYGVNYYTPDLVDTVVKKIQNEKPAEYKTLLSWLEKAKEYNGFYILGV